MLDSVSIRACKLSRLLALVHSFCHFCTRVQTIGNAMTVAFRCLHARSLSLRSFGKRRWQPNGSVPSPAKHLCAPGRGWVMTTRLGLLGRCVLIRTVVIEPARVLHALRKFTTRDRHVRCFRFPGLATQHHHAVQCPDRAVLSRWASVAVSRSAVSRNLFPCLDSSVTNNWYKSFTCQMIGNRSCLGVSRVG